MAPNRSITMDEQGQEKEGNRTYNPMIEYRPWILAHFQEHTGCRSYYYRTRGLAVLPVATGVAFTALLLSLSQHITATLVASPVSFLTALLILIAFAINIALYAHVKHELGKLDISEMTVTGPGSFLFFLNLSRVLTIQQIFGSDLYSYFCLSWLGAL
ncbi:hypothetical protein BDR07DRAFT_909603 [Suillus spraguei]|nr:hypothetical protein BDR07DRAFT_909603 [Suillus spraguei]